MERLDASSKKDAGCQGGRPLVCVVMPAFRAADSIGRAVRSLLEQNYPNIIVGIGVPVRDPETLTAARAIEDPRVVVVEQQGRGISDGRNQVMRQVKASLYMFLDADDMMKPGVISDYVRHRLEDGRPGLRFGHYVRTTDDPNGKEQLRLSPFLGEVQEGFKKLSIMNFVTTGSVMVDREVIDTVGYFDTRFNHGEDWHYWLRVARSYPIFGMDIVAYHYTYGKLTRGRPFGREFCEDAIKVVSDVAPPQPFRFLSFCASRAAYAVYYFRTFGARKEWRELLDIRLTDLLSVFVAAPLWFLRRKRWM